MINTNEAGKLAIDGKSLDSLKQSARNNSPEALKAAAKQFESVLMAMMLKSMRDATPADPLFGNDQTKAFSSMLDQQLSQNLSTKGIGLADILVKQLGPKTNAAVDMLGNKIDNILLTPSISASTNVENVISKRLLKNDALKDSDSLEKKVDARPTHVKEFEAKVALHAEEASKVTGIPAKFMIGQAALESGWGKREIQTKDGSSSFNIFGIKATASWAGKTVAATTTEFINGISHKKEQIFRAYDSYADAFKDYAKLLSKNPRYEHVIATAQDASSFAHGLQKAGYATDPRYAEKLTNIIQKSLTA